MTSVKLCIELTEWANGNRFEMMSRQRDVMSDVNTHRNFNDALRVECRRVPVGRPHEGDGVFATPQPTVAN